MPELATILRNCHGAWRLMLGKRDGLASFDLTVDGFFASFFALVVAAPALLADWFRFATTHAASWPISDSSVASTVVVLAAISAMSWVLPYILVAGLAIMFSFEMEFSVYVIANNWATATLAWLTMPFSLAALLIPGLTGEDEWLDYVILLVSLVLLWRLATTVFRRGPIFATAIILVMLWADFLVIGAGFELFAFRER